MQPIVHPVVGYLCYSLYTRSRHGRRPDDASTVIAVFGAVLPDLIDQPLWLLGITPVGRTFAHSIFGAICFIALAFVITYRYQRLDLAGAFTIGYLSHLAADMPWHLLAGDYDELGFLLWPITDMPSYSGIKVLGTVGGIEITTLWLEVIIFLIGSGLWVSDGRPGLRTVKQWFESIRSR